MWLISLFRIGKSIACILQLGAKITCALFGVSWCASLESLHADYFCAREAFTCWGEHNTNAETCLRHRQGSPRLCQLVSYWSSPPIFAAEHALWHEAEHKTRLTAHFRNPLAELFPLLRRGQDPQIKLLLLIEYFIGFSLSTFRILLLSFSTWTYHP